MITCLEPGCNVTVIPSSILNGPIERPLNPGANVTFDVMVFEVYNMPFVADVTEATAAGTRFHALAVSLYWYVIPFSVAWSPLTGEVGKAIYYPCSGVYSTQEVVSSSH